MRSLLYWEGIDKLAWSVISEEKRTILACRTNQSSVYIMLVPFWITVFNISTVWCIYILSFLSSHCNPFGTCLGRPLLSDIMKSLTKTVCIWGYWLKLRLTLHAVFLLVQNTFGVFSNKFICSIWENFGLQEIVLVKNWIMKDPS